MQKFCHCKSLGLEHLRIHLTIEHLKIYLYFSNCLQPLLIKSDENDQAKNMCFDWSNNCGNLCSLGLVKFILTILKINLVSLKLQTNVIANAQISFAAKFRVILTNGDLPEKCATGIPSSNLSVVQGV